MASTGVNPVSTPPRGVVYFVAVLLVLVAAGGVGLGYKASLRDATRGGAPTGIDDAEGVDQAVVAKPIVDIPAQAVPAPVAATNTLASASNSTANDDNDDNDDSNSVAVRTAAVQHVQSTPAQAAPDIDTILASPTERPQAPAKPSTDDQPPTNPARSDVPF